MERCRTTGGLTSEEDLEPDLVRDMNTLSSLMMTRWTSFMALRSFFLDTSWGQSKNVVETHCVSTEGSVGEVFLLNLKGLTTAFFLDVLCVLYSSVKTYIVFYSIAFYFYFKHRNMYVIVCHANISQMEISTCI